MKVLITGGNGFVGKNLQVKLRELGVDVDLYLKEDCVDEFDDRLVSCDFVVHLAGANRPPDNELFNTINTGLTNSLCESLERVGKKIPVLFASSIQAELDNPYGRSKKSAEDLLLSLQKRCGNRVFIYRLPNVFGKWAKPNYNSVVATFCYNIVNDLPVTINDESALLKLVYIDDVVEEFVNKINNTDTDSLSGFCQVSPVYQTTVGGLEGLIQSFKDNQDGMFIGQVGKGFERALYATYISYKKTDRFCYSLVKHADPRGIFVEMLKTTNSGQFSYFTAPPGVTRGGHYHHTKNEKFLVLKGTARFGFRNILTDECFYIETKGGDAEVVETIPGWAHDITNIGDDEMFVMLWANEVFDADKPDTISYKV